MTYHANPGPSLRPGQPARHIPPHFWTPKTPEERAAANERVRLCVEQIKADQAWRGEAIALRDELDPARPTTTATALRRELQEAAE